MVVGSNFLSLENNCNTNLEFQLATVLPDNAESLGIGDIPTQPFLHLVETNAGERACNTCDTLSKKSIDLSMIVLFAFYMHLAIPLLDSLVLQSIQYRWMSTSLKNVVQYCFLLQILQKLDFENHSQCQNVALRVFHREGLCRF